MKKYKIINVEYNIKETEKLMNEMAEKGWEVVCMTANPYEILIETMLFSQGNYGFKINPSLIITFCCDDSID